nr:hypothetical protein [uncultured Flavobacterium sp.]
MAKIYETPDDLQRDVLLKQKREAAAEASGSLANSLMFVIVGGLGSMLRQVKSHITVLPESQMWKMVGNKSVFSAIEWIGYAFAAKSLVEGIISNNKKSEYKNELAKIGGSQLTIVKEKNGGEQIVYDDLTGNGKVMKNDNSHLFSEAATTIHTSTIQEERLKDLANGKSV